MGKIIISENVTLDGVVEDPTGEERLAGGGWFGQVSKRDRAAWAEVQLAEAEAAGALLLGRRTYEFFAARWPGRTGAFAERLNGMPKFVQSSTLRDPGWANSTVLGGDAVKEAARLKAELAGDIVVYASFELGRVLLEHGLVDEVRLTVYPVVLGVGRRMFDDVGSARRVRLLGTRTVGEGLAMLTYEVIHV